MEGKILVGTASWSDPGFVEFWYPTKLPAAERLVWYAQYFTMVEVNSSFYAVPDPMMAKRWCEKTPEGFVFNVKLHQVLSRHSTPAKLLPPEIREHLRLKPDAKVRLSSEVETEVMRAFEPSLQVLKRAGKLGLLLLQMSPAFSPRKYDLSELDHVFALAAEYRVALELRNRGWAIGARLKTTLRYLRERGGVFVNVDAPQTEHFTVMPTEIDAVTNEKVSYLRLHGRDAKAYLTGKTVATRFNYDYSPREIEEVAKRSRELAEESKQVHIVFNNNARDYAPHAALRLRTALGQLVTPPQQTGELDLS